ncbi:hypothetical protein FACS1894109_02030 [Spirochaetia bacterium]|nr:hypothetical protein FACS1894109_02030 [Spirochaetia bacterium]
MLFHPLLDNFLTDEVIAIIQNLLGNAGILFSAEKSFYFLGRIESFDDIDFSKTLDGKWGDEFFYENDMFNMYLNKIFDGKHRINLITFPTFQSWFKLQSEEVQKNIISCFKNCTDLEDRIYNAAMETHNKFIKVLDIPKAEESGNFLNWRSYPEIKSATRQSIHDLDKSGRFAGIISYVDKYFSLHIKYLGPLRESPKAAYPFTYASYPEDVGLVGENTAMVLQLNGDKITKYCLPPNDNNMEISQKNCTLKDAVNEWLDYLDVADSVSTRTEDGVVFLKIKPKETKEAAANYSLNHLGVGVSQVLPIVVMGLLSPSDTTMLFEQPELHLHPKVQSRLGDFFLSLVKSGKQCIVETHSEYIIDKLRLRIVQAPGDSLVDKVAIYFAEKRDGYSEFRRIRLNEYSVMSEWPEGFFEESMLIADQILFEARKKENRNSEGENND